MNERHIYKPDIHRQRSIRLKGYDYSQTGAYFITICTFDKKHLFGEIVKDNSSCPEIALNAAGEIAEKCWLEIPDHFPNVTIDEYVIMPNHVHGIIVISDLTKRVMAMHPRRGTACRAPTGTIEKFGKPTTGSIPTIIRSYKSAVTNHINQIHLLIGGTVWQRNYHEHVIRNDNDLHDTRKYIIENPLKWDIDEYNPAYKHHS